MLKKRLLILGSGGREHALAKNCASDSMIDHIYVAPGNGGIANVTNISNVDIEVTDFPKIKDFICKNNIDYLIPGPELPLVKGISDYLQDVAVTVFGPDSISARLEGEKSFAKEFMSRHGIKTAKHCTFTSLRLALDYLPNCSYPLVIKADGLAAGKGVFIVENHSAAKAALEKLMGEGQLGKEGKKVVIEEHIQGYEISAIALIHRDKIVPLIFSQDHKRIYDNDKGPNTGGMGAYCPVPFVHKELEDRINREVLQATVSGLNKDGTNYIGFLYAGLMIDKDENIYVLEYNCRMGDPEAQAILFKMESPLTQLIADLQQGKMPQILWKDGYALTVVMASQGYPNSSSPLQILFLPKNTKECFIYHSATKKQGGNLYSNGGRVLAVTSIGNTLEDAKNIAYKTIANIEFAGGQYRKDIGYQALKRGRI